MSKILQLNNFVAELLNIKPSVSKGTFRFYNPREGWVYILSKAQVKGSGHLQLCLSNSNNCCKEIILEHQKGKAVKEAMRFLKEGHYNITISKVGSANLRKLVVRAIPEIIYCKFGYEPHVREYGEYDWNFLNRFVLHNVNCIVGSGDEKEKIYIDKWKSQGKKWIIECGVPGLRDENVTTIEAYHYWTENVGMRNRSLDGIIADEFFCRDAKQYHAWIKAVKKIGENPNFIGKLFYAYCGSLYKVRLGKLFSETIIKMNYKLVFERYLSEQPTEKDAKDLLKRSLIEEMVRWQKALPGVERYMIICLGIMSAPPESLNVDPSVNYKVFLDMQFNALANDPVFRGLYGVMTYTSGYADEEIVRWIGRLYRHYCIEGQRGMLSKDPYILHHIENPDFDFGLSGWTSYPAEKDSIVTKRMKGYSWLQGRYPRTEKGDTFLLMKRSAKKPNIIVQTIKNLVPGRFYSLKMFTADYQDLINGKSIKRNHIITIRLENVKLIPEKSFQHIFSNCYAHHLPPFNDKHKAWMNYHFMIFKAQTENAKLIISDWKDEINPGGPIGQELAINFIEIQPYLVNEY